MIEVHELRKVYGRRVAVERLSFRAQAGQVLALLGPNGAGKSTTIKAITGLLRPTSGTVRLAGFDVARNAVDAKERLGYVPDRPYLYQKLTGRELLRFLGRLRKVDDAERKAQDWLERFELDRVANEMIESYSHGMRQKLTFAAALLHDPQVLVIDEPMVGLDPRAALQVRGLMRDWADRGRTVLLTTHSMEVAQAVADRVLLLASGRIAAAGTMGELRTRVGRSDADLEAIFLQLTEEERMASEPAPAAR